MPVDIKVTLFTNNIRGFHCYKYLKKKKKIIKNIIIAKKNLNKTTLRLFDRTNLKYTLINNLNNYKALKILKNTDIGLVCGFPYIFKPSQLRYSKYGYLNLHAGQLPKYRGGSPLNWQIINNEKYFGISIIKINKGIDTGDIVIQKKFKLLRKYKIEDLHRISNKNFGKMLYRALNIIIKKKKLKKQNNNKAQYFKQRSFEDSRIKPSEITYKDLQLLDRAMSNSYPRPFFVYKSKKIIINKFKIVKIKNKNDSSFFKKNKKSYLNLKDSTIELK
jgi:methionyl-tRNA formyltransferase